MHFGNRIAAGSDDKFCFQNVRNRKNCDAVCLEYRAGSRDIRMEIMEYTDTILTDRDGDAEIQDRDRADQRVRTQWKLPEKVFRARERRELSEAASHTIHCRICL